MNKNNRHKRIGLTLLYGILLGSILFAFPRKWGSEDLVNTFSSAPKKSSADYIIPNAIIRWVTNTWANKTQTPTSSWTYAKTTIKTEITTTKTQKTSCADINMCHKIHLSDSYTNAQKIKYYNALLQTLGYLNAILPQSPSLTDTLFSVTLSPEGTTDKRRWWGGSKTLLLQTNNITTMQEFREVLTHELAHIIDLGMITGKSDTKDTNFAVSENTYFSSDDPSLGFYKLSWENSTTRLADASYLDFVWWYATSSPFEDFAETFTMYMRHKEIFKQRTTWSSILKKKYEFIESVTQWETLWKSSTTSQDNLSRRPWDVTRISLE